MRRSLLVLCFVYAMAVRAEIGPSLPVVHRQDTEVTTNFPFVAQLDRSGRFDFTLSCHVSSSNNVEVAFGRDDNGNGILELEEIDRIVGWDCGRWFTRRGADGVYVSETVGIAVGMRELCWELQVGPQGSPRSLHALADGVPVFVGMPLDSVFNPSWNMLRLTGRGLDASLESFTVSVKPYGTTIIMR